MAVEKLVAGAVATYTSVVTSSVLNGLAAGNAIMSDVAYDNSSIGDVFADVWFKFGSITIAAPFTLYLYLYPLGQDGTTYGDGRYASAAAGPPSSQYYAGFAGCPSGSNVPSGVIRGVALPLSQYKYVFFNGLGAALAGSGANAIYHKTFNRSVA